MKFLRQLLGNATQRVFALFLILSAAFVALALPAGLPLNWETAFSVLQNFSTLGPVALGLGLTMLVREFDISFAGMFGLGGCVAVLVGATSPALGIAAAVAVGLLGGAAQGVFMTRLRLSSVAVTLGGLLTFGGIAYVLTGNRNVPLGNLELAMSMNAPILEVFSIRSLVAWALFIVAAVVVGYTRTGRDMIATGSDLQASVLAGVRTDAIIIGVFGASGTLSALAGAMLSYSLSTASPAGLSDVSVPAVAAVILGGASLSGGTGRPLGIAAGVLVLCLLRTGLTTVGVPPYVHELVTGAILLAFAIGDGADLMRRLTDVERFRSFRLRAPGPRSS